MTTLREAVQQALEFIKVTNARSQFWLVPGSNLNKTVKALKTALEQPEQEPKWRLSCGCPSQHGGIPAEWPETDREGNPAVAYGVICERHWHEYGARHQEPIGSMKIRPDMGADISFNRSFTLEPGMEFALCVAAPKEGKA